MTIAIRETYDDTAGTGTNPSVREDLADIIYDISPTDTPFISAVGKGTCKSTYTEWQTDELEGAAVNRKQEGVVAGAAAHGDTTRVGNYTQISDKVVEVSGTNEAVDSAGFASSMAYETMKKGLELRNDMELMLIADPTAIKDGGEGLAGTPDERIAAGVLSWIGTAQESDGSASTIVAGNAINGIGDSGVAGTGAAVNDNGGTAYAWSEGILELMVDNCYSAGGSPNVLMVSPANKRITNGFVGRANATTSADAHNVNTDSMSKRISNTVDFYDSDYGSFAIVPNRHMRNSEVYLLQTDMWSVDYLRDFQTIDLAKDGDTTKKQLLVEYTLKSNNQKASSAAYNLSTS